MILGKVYCVRYYILVFFSLRCLLHLVFRFLYLIINFSIIYKISITHFIFSITSAIHLNLSTFLLTIKNFEFMYFSLFVRFDLSFLYFSIEIILFEFDRIIIHLIQYLNLRLLNKL